jgi:hypothetical protein
MKFRLLSLALALNAAVSTALKIPFQRVSPLQRRNGGASVSVSRTSAALTNNNILAAATGGGNDNANAFDMKCVQQSHRIRHSFLKLS